MLFLPRYLIVITCQTTRAGVGVLFLLCVCVVVGSALIATHAPHRRDCAPTSYLDSPSCRSNATRQSVLPRAAAIALQLPAKPSPITFETCLPAALHVPSCTVTTCTSPPSRRTCFSILTLASVGERTRATSFLETTIITTRQLSALELVSARVILLSSI
jgi:hypothetical protein